MRLLFSRDGVVAESLLTASGLHLWRGERHVLRGVSFELRAGELLHVRGPNGSGKTSLLRVVCGLLHLEAGSVRWRGRGLRDLDGGFAGELSYLAHDNALKGELTAEENLYFEVGLRRRLQPEQVQAALDELGVGRCARLPCRVLSAGQRRRVALARVLLSGARVWALDEPFSNLDAESSARIIEALSRHLDGGGVALVAAHQSFAPGSGTVVPLELH